MANNKRLKRGFTIVELMITMVVLALLGGMVAWNSNAFNRAARLRSATRDVLGLLNYARNQAMVKRRIFRVRVGRAGASMDFSIAANVLVPQGAVYVQEGETSSVATAFPAIPNTQIEALVRAMDQMYKDIEISHAYRLGNAAPASNLVENIFFRPDGQALSCTGAACTTTEFFICVRGMTNFGSADIASTAKVIQIRANGSVAIPSDPLATSATGVRVAVPQCP